MAEFFFSVPGAVALVGLGMLVLTRGAGARRPAARSRAADDSVRPVMQIAVSIVMLAAGLWVMLSGHYGADAMHWASGAIGTVVGYWLKP
jgi:hypothetical protein